MIDSIKEYFSNLGNMSLLDLVPFIMGLIFGFVFCVMIYCIVVLTSFKNSKKIAYKKNIEVDDEVIKKLIMNARNTYSENAASLKTAEKVDNLKTICWDLMNDIAKIYYPESKYPMFELSIEELITLDYYIMKRIENLFNGKILSKLKRLNISSIMKVLDMKKKYEENKVVKAANKAKIPGIMKTVWSAVNFVNPVYWVKKLMIDAPFQLIINKIALIIIDVVGEETANVYSKNAFIPENKEMEEQVKEIEKMLGE